MESEQKVPTHLVFSFSKLHFNMASKVPEQRKFELRTRWHCVCFWHYCFKLGLLLGRIYIFFKQLIYKVAANEVHSRVCTGVYWPTRSLLGAVVNSRCTLYNYCKMHIPTRTKVHLCVYQAYLHRDRLCRRHESNLNMKLKYLRKIQFDVSLGIYLKIRQSTRILNIID